MDGRVEITIKEEQEWIPFSNENGYLGTPEFVIRENGIRVGSIPRNAPEVAKKIIEALNKPAT